MTAGDWLYAGLLVLATALSRSTLLLIGGRLKISPRLDTALRYAPACALAAILAPQLLATNHGQLVGWQGSAPLWGAIATGLLMIWTRSISLAISGGMIVFWLLRWAGLPA